MAVLGHCSIRILQDFDQRIFIIMIDLCTDDFPVSRKIGLFDIIGIPAAVRNNNFHYKSLTIHQMLQPIRMHLTSGSI